MEKQYELKLQLYGKALIPAGGIQYVMNDSGVYPLEIQLLGEDNEPYPIPEGLSAEVNLMSARGTRIPKIGEITDAGNGVIFIGIEDADMPDEGRYDAAVTLTDGASRLTWPEFNYYVRRSLAGGEPGSAIVNQNTLTVSKAYTDGAVKTEAAARTKGDKDTLTSANKYADNLVKGLTPDYTKLENLPTLEGAQIIGAMTAAQLGLAAAKDLAAEAKARDDADTAIEETVAEEATARQSGDENTLTAAEESASSGLAAHNAAPDAHEDIRSAVSGVQGEIDVITAANKVKSGPFYVQNIGPKAIDFGDGLSFGTEFYSGCDTVTEVRIFNDLDRQIYFVNSRTDRTAMVSGTFGYVDDGHIAPGNYKALSAISGRANEGVAGTVYVYEDSKSGLISAFDYNYMQTIDGSQDIVFQLLQVEKKFLGVV